MRNKSIRRICLQCDGEFGIDAWTAEHRGSRFCSRPCWILWYADPARVWERFDRTGDCWLWQKAVDTNGYGSCNFLGRVCHTHVLSYTLAVGPVPPGLLVCHSCERNYAPGDIGYRRCGRPDHLYLGTHQDNASDMVASGRSRTPRRLRNAARGEDNASAVLTADIVRSLRADHAAGMTVWRALGRRYHVHWSTAKAVVERESWSHVV
jgi:hypothetical protein